MRSSLISRSVVAVASLAIGSVALAAVPATAATPSGTTRDQVLSLAASARTDDGELSDATRAAAAQILNRECGIQAPRVITAGSVRDAQPVAVDAAVDGVYLSGIVRDENGQGTQVGECAIGIVATRTSGGTLSGNASLTTSSPFSPTVTTPSTSLSGDVSAIIERSPAAFSLGHSFKASGTASKTTSVTTTVKVKDPKSKAEKKAAKKKYAKRIASAKKSYKKALAKAKSSKSKKAAATKSYKAKRATAKASYKKAIAGFKLVKKTSTSTQNTSFSVSSEAAAPIFPPVPNF